MLYFATRRFGLRSAFSVIGARAYHGGGSGSGAVIGAAVGAAVGTNAVMMSKLANENKIKDVVATKTHEGYYAEVDPDDAMVKLNIGEEDIIVKHVKTPFLKGKNIIVSAAYIIGYAFGFGFMTICSGIGVFTLFSLIIKYI